MDSIDVLGIRPDRRTAFTRDLLTETDNAELQQIVEKAAEQLSTPIALVTLVLDQIQYFKAHYGLPPDLAAARGTRRDVSFCQFVVRDDQAFEITDARNDARIPQHLVREYGIRSYLGIPIRAGQTVLGSLCVLDTKARQFSDAQRHSLAELAALVNERVRPLVTSRPAAHSALTDTIAEPALAELRESLAPVRSVIDAGLPALAAIRSFIRLSAYVLEGGSASPEVMKRSLDAAAEATEATESGLHDLMMAAADCEDCLLALEHLTTPSTSTHLSQVLVAAQDLARRVTEPVGGAPLPHLPSDPLVAVPRPLAVSLLSTLLMNVAVRLAKSGASSGVRIQLFDLGATAELAVSAEGFSNAMAKEVASELSEQVGNDTSVDIQGTGEAVRLSFPVVSSRDPE